VRYGGRFGVAYTTTTTFGPYRGDLDETSSEPGHVPDGEARAISCQNSQEPILKGAFRINHQTSHGTTDRDVLRFSSIGTFWDTENDSLRFGGFVHPPAATAGTACRSRSSASTPTRSPLTPRSACPNAAAVPGLCTQGGPSCRSRRARPR
jgi:hypothetical protein